MKLSLYGKATIVACIQYDVYKNINDVVKAVRSEHKHCLQTQLQSQGAILSFVLDHSLSVTNPYGLQFRARCLKIFNFAIRYLISKTL